MKVLLLQKSFVANMKVLLLNDKKLIYREIKGVVLKMAVKIRLKRIGAKKAPFYRVVVADSKYPRDGRFIEEIGIYNPMVEPSLINIDLEKVKKWIGNGAQPTESVKNLLSRVGYVKE